MCKHVKHISRLQPHMDYVCLQNDLAAGISVAALVIPQGMSYAKLAGLPNQYGLYGAFVPVIIYATLGSSRHLVSCPSMAMPCAVLDFCSALHQDAVDPAGSLLARFEELL